MMRSLTFLSLCAVASIASSDASAARNAEEMTLSRNFVLTPSDNEYFDRLLQAGAEGIFRATWGTDHTGKDCIYAINE